MPTVAAALGLLSVLVTSTTFVKAQPTVGTTAHQDRDYNIAAQSLNAAIEAYATTSDIDVLYDHKLGENRRSNAVIGRFTPQRAMLLLLEGTGLVSRFSRPNAAVILSVEQAEKRYAVDAPKTAAINLDPLRITASPVIGQEAIARFQSYGRAAQLEIYQRLHADPELASIPFFVDLRVGLDALGSVRNFEFVQGSGRQDVDARVQLAITQLRLARSPPVDMPMPLRFRIRMGQR